MHIILFQITLFTDTSHFKFHKQRYFRVYSEKQGQALRVFKKISTPPVGRVVFFRKTLFIRTLQFFLPMKFKTTYIMDKNKKTLLSRLIISLLKLSIPLLLIIIVIWLASSFAISPILIACIILFAGNVIRLLYKIVCILVSISLFILIICLIAL